MRGGATRFTPTHGMRNSVEYRVWQDMLNRCRNPKVRSYPNYGGRGITVCDRWQDFSNFYQDLGPRPMGYSLERIDSNGNYEPSNVKWIPLVDQQRNKRNNHFITYDGITDTLSGWAKRIGVKRATLSRRINKYNWPIEKALNENRNHRISKT